ncbi:MAG: M20/M25/M40 family metallo-hydrolase [Candidatus Aminicenantes bacterium]|nr:M20/M25/M40 family metallo-hydrolase [Candidatus Aminicenantes bacterium]
MIRMSVRRRVWGAAVPAMIFLCLLVFAVPSEDTVLVRIEKTDAERIPVEMEADILIVQELRTSLIAVVPSSRWDGLAGLGISGKVLDGDADGKAYFLVYTPRPGDPDVLKKFGTAVSLDERTCLFWSGAAEAREILPSVFKIKRLWLDRQIAWSRPGKAVAEPPEARADVLSDPWITGWVAKVAKVNLTASIQSLQNFKSRYTSTGTCQSAGTYLYNRFIQMGLSCSYEPFTFSRSSISTRNVIARLPGKKYPGQVVIVCAHYDSISDRPVLLAPGADDNASGTAAVLEIARVLAGKSFEYTVKFICFSAEEWGLYGSENYARRAKNRGEKIVGVINMDMVSYTDATRKKLEIYVNSSSNWLGSKFIQTAATYAPLPIAKYVDGSADWSDHWSFWDYGFYALCGIESAADWNPYYHRTTDTLDKLNLNFCVSVTKASLATVAVLAKPYTATAALSGPEAWSPNAGFFPAVSRGTAAISKEP